MRFPRSVTAACVALDMSATALQAQVPHLINYQGRVIVGSTSFSGTGQFKFALVDTGGTTTFWSNDGTSVAGSQPTAAVALPVANGLYSVLLGDTSLPNMMAIPAAVFANSDVRLRVWFNDGTNGSQLLSPDQRIAAVGYAIMAGSVPAGAISSVQLAPGAAAANLAEAGLSAVATGGVILSQQENSSTLTAAGYIKLGETMTVDFWKQRSFGGAPFARREHTAVWTGSEMIVWGGLGSTLTPTKTGGRYQAATDTWTAMSLTDSPEARSEHTAIWTGDEMVVWGGRDPGAVYVNTGGQYNPTLDTWTATPTAGAPAGRPAHNAVWTGEEMIVWGGSGGLNVNNTGGRYNPVADAWQPTNTAGTPNVGSGGHTAVWTGSEMIVWGGQRLDGTFPTSGGRYDPVGDSWVATSTTGVPAGRTGHTAIWTGSEMIIWGGRGTNPEPINTGGRYTANGSWVATPTASAPSARVAHSAVWTGQEMIVWGNTADSSGGRYNPALASPWAPMSTSNVPVGRLFHTVVWTGNEMIIFGGQVAEGSALTSNVPFSYTPPRSLYLYHRP